LVGEAESLVTSCDKHGAAVNVINNYLSGNTRLRPHPWKVTQPDSPTDGVCVVPGIVQSYSQPVIGTEHKAYTLSLTDTVGDIDHGSWAKVQLCTRSVQHLTYPYAVHTGYTLNNVPGMDISTQYSVRD